MSDDKPQKPPPRCGAEAGGAHDAAFLNGNGSSKLILCRLVLICKAGHNGGENMNTIDSRLSYLSSSAYQSQRFGENQINGSLPR